jgi:hypothetical protein
MVSVVGGVEELQLQSQEGQELVQLHLHVNTPSR